MPNKKKKIQPGSSASNNWIVPHHSESNRIQQNYTPKGVNELRIVIMAISFCEYVIQQANSIAWLGHNVMVIMPSKLIDETVGQDVHKILSPSVTHYFYEVSKNDRVKPHFYKALFRQISTFSPTLLHVHENSEIETVAVCLKFHKLPLILTTHDVQLHIGEDSKISLRRKIFRKMLRFLADKIHVHSIYLKDKLKQLDKGLFAKCVTIPHGTLSLFKYWESELISREPYTCLFFGRMEKYRGLDNLIIIGEILKRELPKIKIIVAGRGSELAAYKEKMLSIGVFEVHDYFIPDNKIHEFFNRATLLLLPYHEASQSGIIHMGLAFGVPIVATAVGSIPETLINGTHGCLVKKDDNMEFAQAVKRLLLNVEQTDHMRDACTSLGKTLDYTNLASSFETAYFATIDKKASRSTFCM